MKRESLKLWESDWFWLQEVAFDTGSIYSGKPSWRRLVARIARGELVVSVAVERATTPRPAPAPFVQGPSSSDVQRIQAAAEKRMRKLAKRESGD
jgi:hypothetical protein